MIGYARMSVDNAPVIYSATELELLALGVAYEFRGVYLRGVDFTRVTDHSALL